MAALKKSSPPGKKQRHVRFTEEDPIFHTYPNVIQETSDQEILYYTSWWLRFIKKNNDRDLEAIKKGSLGIESRGMECQIDPEKLNAKRNRWRNMTQSVLNVQNITPGDHEAIAKASCIFTKPAVELARELALADARFVEENVDLEDDEQSFLPSWIWDACDLSSFLKATTLQSISVQ